MSAPAATQDRGRLRAASDAVLDFFLRPASPRPLAALRIGLGLLLLAQAYCLRHSQELFFAGDGLIQGDLARALAEPGQPRLSWLVQALAPLHLSELTVIHWVCGAYVAALVALVAGFFAQPVALACWLLHWLLENTGQTTNYGVDLYTHVFLFYLIWFPSGLRAPASSRARLGLRVAQLHLAISYLCSAVEKGSGPQWWNGEVLWRSLNLPVYRQFDFLWLAHVPWLPRLAGLGSLALEAGYIVFIWPRRTRGLWVLGIVGLHLGIAVFLGLKLFGVVMALLTLAIFGVSEEPGAEPLAAGAPRPLLLFDGVCNLCNATVAFVARRDRAERVALESLQSEAGRARLAEHGLPTQDLSSLVLIEGGKAYLKSDAVIRLLRQLPGVWPYAADLLALLPRGLRDAGYAVVARNRYRLFGRRQVCELAPRRTSA